MSRANGPDWVICHAKVVLPDEVVDDCAVRVEGDRIAAVGRDMETEPGDRTIDAKGAYLAPGFIDLHMHVGFLGREYPPRRELKVCARNLPANGTTRYLATLVGARQEGLCEHVAAVRELLKGQGEGARPLGAHLEGPYIAPGGRGAMSLDQIATPAALPVAALLEEGQDVIRLMTVSPEVDGIVPVIRECVARGVVVGVGHTLAGVEAYEVARQAGATHVCHTYNNRPAFPDAPPGLRGVALDDLAVLDDDVTCEVISDGVHVAPTWLKMLYRAKGPDGICLITDSFMAGRRAVEGETFGVAGGHPITVRGGVGRLPDGCLAGSALTQDRAIRVFMTHTGASVPEAVRSASLVPARVLGLDDQLGSIAVGKIADLVLLDSDWQPIMTWTAGRVAFREGLAQPAR